MFYNIGRWIALILGYPFVFLYFKTKIYYEDKSVQSRKIDGGALIVTNHFNQSDFAQNMFVLCPHKLCVVAAEIAFANPFLRFGMKFFGGIEANRVTKDKSFVKKSVEEIKKGNLVQIFPEGHNTPDGKIHPFYKSYLAIPLESRAPIIPIVTDGNYGFFKRARIIIGKPINVWDYMETDTYTREDFTRLNDIVFNKVLELRQEIEDRKISERTKNKK